MSSAHHRDSYSPEKCSWNQSSGPVWFLPDGKDQPDLSAAEIRECTVPEGKALMVQIVGSGCSTGEGLKNDQELLDCAVWVLPTAEFSASVDGVEVMNTKSDPSDRDKFYVEPFKTNLTYVDRNYYEVEPGTYDGMVAGYYLFVPPLPPGEHEIKFSESAIEFLSGFPSDKRLSNVEYHITVHRTPKEPIISYEMSRQNVLLSSMFAQILLYTLSVLSCRATTSSKTASPINSM